MSRKKVSRNQRLIEFITKHPDWVSESIGAIFHISGSRVRAIKNTMLKKEGESNG